MKNGLLIWNVLLTLVVGYLFYIHFSSKTATVKPKVATSDTTGRNDDFRIAYFEMDSVEANLNIVKDVKLELGRREDAIKTELESMGRRFQERKKYFEQKLESGGMTQTDIDDAQRELQKMDNDFTVRKDALNQEYSNYASASMKSIKTKIEDFVKEYNVNRNFSFIIAEEPGLFYFKDTLYNITNDVIRGINERHKSSKKE
jgi:outer membrane protein